MSKGIQGFQKGHKINLDRKRPDVSKLMRGNKYALGNKPNKTSFKKGIHPSLKTEFKKGLIPWDKGKKRPEVSGIKSNLWKGGITSENAKIRSSIEFRLWREAVFARDNWTCQKYGIKGEKLHPHHIQNFAQYPELRFAIDNGITLSDKAHKEFHKKYGYRNNTKEQLREFM